MSERPAPRRSRWPATQSISHALSPLRTPRRNRVHLAHHHYSIPMGLTMSYLQLHQSMLTTLAENKPTEFCVARADAEDVEEMRRHLTLTLRAAMLYVAAAMDEFSEIVPNGKAVLTAAARIDD